MDRIDVLLIVVAGYVAVMSLVRLMTARRDEVVRQLRAELDHRRAAAANDDDRDIA